MKIMQTFCNGTILNRAVRGLTIALLFLFAQAASAQCLRNEPLRGINLAGAEFNSGRIPGTPNKDYAYPNAADIDYFKSAGANIIRLPFRWERIQPVLFKPLDPAELRRIAQVVAKASDSGVCVILDVHNYALYGGQTIGSEAVPREAFFDLWTRLAAEFNDPDKTIYGLMNEPAKISIDQWAPIAQQTVDAIRKSGSKNIILAAGGNWSGAHEWSKRRGATSNADAFAGFKDPLHRTWLEAHQYADPNFSGTGPQCVAPVTLQKILGDLTAWARQNHQKMFIGEFGVPPSDDCLAVLDTMLAAMDDKKVWRGWTYWAAGRWWNNYPMSVQPKNGQDAPQMVVLRKHFDNQ
jgi:endoglucanase